MRNSNEAIEAKQAVKRWLNLTSATHPVMVGHPLFFWRPVLTTQERKLYYLTWAVLAAILVAGFAAQGAADTLRGVWYLQLHPARLINDYTAIAGAGATKVNAALVAIIGLILIRLSGTRVSGPTISAVYTMLGFGFFGKTPLNSLPIILGVYVAARLAGKKFNEYILIALFGTALAPIVSMVAVELIAPGASSWIAAVAAGIGFGILLPPAAMVMLRFHQGYNLYNIGLTSGFLGLFAASLVIAAGGLLPGSMIWNLDPPLVLRLLIPALSVVLLAAGLLGASRSALRDFVRINRLSGRLPSDFMDMVSIRGTLVNMGVLGLASWVYVLAVGAPLNGPVIGGILTIVGFGGFGKHPANCWAVMAGVLAATLLFGVEPAAPGAILAILFGTTLAPLAGDFGIGIGFVAGFLHLVMVSRSGAWHTGLSLYNNGFAGGLTATLLAGFMEWYQANRDTAVKEEQ
jgi:hypothetical protein